MCSEELGKKDHSHPKKYVWKKAATRNDFRTHTDKYIEKFWNQSIKPNQSVSEVDSMVHTLIHNLLLKGEDNPANIHSVHLHSSMLKHQQ